MQVGRWLVALLALLSIAKSFAATAVQTELGVSKPIDLIRHTRYVVDSENDWQYADVVRIDPEAFESIDGEELNLGLGQAGVWLRIELPSEVASLEECLLVVPSPIIDRVLVIPSALGSEGAMVGGDRSPFAARPSRHRHYVFPLEQCLAGALVFVHLQSESPIRFRVYVTDARSFFAHQAPSMLALGAFYGLMVGLVLYNLLLIAVDFETSRIYYLAYISFATIVAAIVDGLPSQFGSPSWWPNHANVIALLLAHAVLFSGLNFVRSYLKVQDANQWVDRSLMACAGLVFVSAVAVVLVDGPLAQRLVHLAVLISLMVIGTSILALVAAGLRQAKILLITFAGLAIPAVLWSAQTQGVIELGAIGDYLLHLGFATEALLLSFALADRINHLSEQRLRAEQKLVEERVSFSKDLLTAREHQQREFAKELHDAIGQNVLVLKTRLDRWGSEATADTSKRYQQASEIAAVIAEATRGLAHRLHPSVLERLGLSEALSGLTAALADNGLSVELNLCAELDHLGAEPALQIYRIFQEACANVVRHAEASKVTFVARANDAVIELELNDNGVGFSEQRARHAGLGMQSMHERAALIGAALVFSAPPNEGSCIRLLVPWDKHSET